MEILKSKLEDLIRELPDKVDIEDIMYRLYLLEKIEAGEKNIMEGKAHSHEDVVKMLSKKWQN